MRIEHTLIKVLDSSQTQELIPKACCFVDNVASKLHFKNPFEGGDH